MDNHYIGCNNLIEDFLNTVSRIQNENKTLISELNKKAKHFFDLNEAKIEVFNSHIEKIHELKNALVSIESKKNSLKYVASAETLQTIDSLKKSQNEIDESYKERQELMAALDALNSKIKDQETEKIVIGNKVDALVARDENTFIDTKKHLDNSLVELKQSQLAIEHNFIAFAQAEFNIEFNENEEISFDCANSKILERVADHNNYCKLHNALKNNKEFLAKLRDKLNVEESVEVNIPISEPREINFLCANITNTPMDITQNIHADELVFNCNQLEIENGGDMDVGAESEVHSQIVNEPENVDVGLGEIESIENTTKSRDGVQEDLTENTVVSADSVHNLINEFSNDEVFVSMDIGGDLGGLVNTFYDGSISSPLTHLIRDPLFSEAVVETEGDNIQEEVFNRSTLSTPPITTFNPVNPVLPTEDFGEVLFPSNISLNNSPTHSTPKKGCSPLKITSLSSPKTSPPLKRKKGNSVTETMLGEKHLESEQSVVNYLSRCDNQGNLDIPSTSKEAHNSSNAIEYLKDGMDDFGASEDLIKEALASAKISDSEMQTTNNDLIFVVSANSTISSTKNYKPVKSLNVRSKRCESEGPRKLYLTVANMMSLFNPNKRTCDAAFLKRICLLCSKTTPRGKVNNLKAHLSTICKMAKELVPPLPSQQDSPWLNTDHVMAIFCNEKGCQRVIVEEKDDLNHTALKAHFRKMHKKNLECNATINGLNSSSIREAGINFYYCTFCETDQPNITACRAEMCLHLITHHTEIVSPCPVCSKPFPLRELRIHCINHLKTDDFVEASDKKLKCKKCGQQMNNLSTVSSHVSNCFPYLKRHTCKTFKEVFTGNCSDMAKTQIMCIGVKFPE